MCFFKKKKKVEEPINSLFQMGESIRFRNPRGELTNGYIYDIHKTSTGEIIYDVQIGGECPVIYNDIPENKIIKRK